MRGGGKEREVRDEGGGERKAGRRRERGRGREALTHETSVSLCFSGRGSWLQICGSGSHTVCGMVSRLLPAPQTPQTVSSVSVECECVMVQCVSVCVECVSVECECVMVQCGVCMQVMQVLHSVC